MTLRVALTLSALIAGCGGRVQDEPNQPLATDTGGLDDAFAVPDVTDSSVLLDAHDEDRWTPCGERPKQGVFSCCEGRPCRGVCSPITGACNCFGTAPGGCAEHEVCCGHGGVCRAPGTCK